jgi:hypothetical protein
LKYLIKVDEFPIGIIYNFYRRRFFCEKYCAAAEERLTVNPMLWDETQNPTTFVQALPKDKNTSYRNHLVLGRVESEYSEGVCAPVRQVQAAGLCPLFLRS